jgi:hypothetical protein
MIETSRTDKVDHVKVEKLIKKIEIYLSTKEKRKEMAEQIINIELLLTTGDTLRESQRKSKENFAELYSLSGGAVNIDGKEDKTNKQNDLTADVTNLKY